MRLSLQREQLLKPLQFVIGAVDHKQAMPVLSNVLLHINNNQLSVTGTDLEIELVGYALLDRAETPQRLTLPARKLFDICKALPESALIELFQDNDRIILTSNRSRFMMTTLPADEFPNIQASEYHVSFAMTQQELTTLLHRTAFAMAEQDVRYYLNGLLLEITENNVRVVATDGHRLALNQILMNTHCAHRLQVIIPYKAVMELMRLLKEAEKLLTIDVGHHHIRISCDDFVFTSKLVESRYPEYQRVIPKASNNFVTIDRDILKFALQRIAVLCHDKVRGMRLELQNNQLKLTAHNPAREVAEEEIEVDYHGAPLDIGFNITYLIDALNIVRAGNIRLSFADANNSMRIDEPGSEGKSIFVVMPMRI